jgi:peptidoglycan hydrolase-like protein with peptidoglycan-binding domain
MTNPSSAPAPDTLPPIPHVSPLPTPADSSGMVLRGPAQPGSDRAAVERIRAAQHELARVGCFSGPADGNFTDATRDAVKDYWMSTGRTGGEIVITEALIADIRQHEARVCASDDHNR